MDVPRQSCSKLVTTMCFLADREVARLAAGLLSEADGVTGKINEGVAALVTDGVTDETESIGTTGVRSCWANKRFSVGHVRSWSKEHGLQGIVGTRTSVGKGWPMECPTTHFGRTSSGSPWGCQLLAGTLQASRRVWMAVTMVAPACLWVKAHWQLSKQWPLINQDRQASLSLSLGRGAVAFRSLASNIMLRDTMFTASQCFLMDAFQLVLVTQLPLVALAPPEDPDDFWLVGLTCSNQLTSR